MELQELEALWEQIQPWLALVLQIATVIVGAVLTLKKIKSSLTDTTTQNAFEENVLKGISKQIQTVSFQHDIAPIVESKMASIQEKAIAQITEQLKTMQTQYANLVAILASLASYFDNSIGVPEEKKEELKENVQIAQSQALQSTTMASNVVVLENTQETPNKPTNLF